MTGPSLLQNAVDELYSHPMSEFTGRRKALAAAAKKAGDREISAQIAALRKPTVAADTVNRLVRAAADEVGELLDLGVQLREAEKALNGPELRELSAKRRHLVSDLARLAFDITEQAAPSASVREEVTSTLNAALADENIADMLLSGALVTQARWDGFGSTSLPELAVVLPLDAGRLRAASGPAARQRARPDEDAPHQSAPDADVPTADPQQPESGGPGRAEPGKGADRGTSGRAVVKVTVVAAAEEDTGSRIAAKKAERVAAKKAAEREAVRAQAEQARLHRLEAAQDEAEAADDAAEQARESVRAIDRSISELSMKLAHQRQLLEQAQKDARAADARRRAAQLALTRVGGAVPG